MGGGLLQLVAYGAQDAYISGNPQITFFKTLYKRHTNFAMEAFRVNFNGQAAWGVKHSAVIGRHADLMYSTYLEVVLDSGNYNNDQGRLGYNLLHRVELEIGGQLIDRLYGEFMYLWECLSQTYDKKVDLEQMVGAIGKCGSSYSSSNTIVISELTELFTMDGSNIYNNSRIVDLYKKWYRALVLIDKYLGGGTPTKPEYNEILNGIVGTDNPYTAETITFPLILKTSIDTYEFSGEWDKDSSITIDSSIRSIQDLIMDTSASITMGGGGSSSGNYGSVYLGGERNCNSSGSPSLPNTILYIPLSFFYTKNPGVALPLIALQYHEVRVNVIWNDVKTIAGNFTYNLPPQPLQCALYVDYIYLDTEERRRMAQQSHEYLIEQTQFNEDKSLSSYSNRIDLTFNHPVKELIWVVQPSYYTNCNIAKGKEEFRLKPFTYDQAAVFEQLLQINGQDRMDKRYGDYYNKVQRFQHHTGNGVTVSNQCQPGIYSYSFALKPEEHQPSGTCNFSRIDTAHLLITLSGDVKLNHRTDDTYDVRVYAINYNILRIMSGMGGLAYSN
jgi:hypothetical protein